MTRSRTPVAEPTGSGGTARPKRARDGLSTRERIIHRAAELFAANGYHATGISELLEAVEVSRGTFYYHIDSKDTLLFEISLTQVSRMNEVAGAIAESEMPPSEKMRLLARSLVRNIAEYEAEWTVFFREFTALQGERRTEILRERERYEATWMSVLEDGTRQGEFGAVSGLHLKGILGMLNYSYLWLDPAGALDAEQIADCFVDLLLDGLRKRD